ncbi:MAG: Carboxyl-terminal protease [candidate division TM6 bacterium GW2011_GWF2_32_72]|nr:MAG: Carboxyl-terminal protease [candidate division TM6 bacterium GW2011_GWF2_32_72]
MKRNPSVIQILFLITIFGLTHHIGTLDISSWFTFNKDESAEKEKKHEDKFTKDAYNWSRTFAETLHYLHTKYYGDVDVEKSMVQALNALMEQCPHSAFMDPKSYKKIMESTSGEFSGIGVIITPKEANAEALAIIDTIPEGPADKAGLRAGDKIIEVEGKALRGIPEDEVIASLKGPKKSTVKVKIKREGNNEFMDFTITRDIVKEETSISFFFEKQNVCYIALSVFAENSAKQLENLLNKAIKHNYKGLILDLRNNSGGLLDSVIDISGLFLPKNSTVVITKDKNGNVIDEYKTKREPVTNGNIPIFILINNHTASAAEILSGGLRAHSEQLAKKNPNKKELLVFLVGTDSFGKGSVQEVIPVSNDCAIKLTTSLYYLPNNTSIQGIGVKPDFKVEPCYPEPDSLKWLNENYGHESKLKNYIKVSENEEKKKDDEKKEDKNDESNKKAWKERKIEMLKNDSQVQTTINLIEMLSLDEKAFPEQTKNRTMAIDFLKKYFVTDDQQITLEEIK